MRIGPKRAKSRPIRRIEVSARILAIEGRARLSLFSRESDLL